MASEQSRDHFVVVVHVALTRPDGQVFFLRRAHTGFLDGFYGLPGGHQQADEGVQAAARREVLEETGVVVKALHPVAALPYRHKQSRGVNFVFVSDDFDGEPGLNEPDLFDHCCWLPWNRLPEPHPLWVREAARLADTSDWFFEFD